MTTQAIERIQLEVLRNRYQAVVEEMASIILRAGHTVFVKETADFGAVLASPDGEVFAASLDIGVTVMIGLPLRDALNSVKDYREGDVIIANDPYSTGGMCTHLPDLFVWQPIFVDGSLLCFALAFVHSSDVGGIVPGSVSVLSSDIHQEGLRLRPTKLREAGHLNRPIMDLILLNCRIPRANEGDLRALIAALGRANQRMHELVSRYGEAEVRGSVPALLEYAESEARRLLGGLTNGTYTFADYMEGDAIGLGPIRIVLTIRLQDGDAYLDFEGTEPQVRGALNLPTYSKDGHWMIILGFVNFFRTVNPNVPYNSGLTRPLHLSAPKGSLVNPHPGAACGVRAATMTRILDMVMACLGQAAPDVVPAAGAGQIAIVLAACLDPADGEYRVSVAQPLGGGSGGRPYADGIDGVDFSAAWLRNIPSEVLESDIPITVLEYGLLPDSGGAGEHRGGCGIVLRLRVEAPFTVITARGLERYCFRPWGRRGARPGSRGTTVVRPATGEAFEPGKFGSLTLQPGDEITFRTQGGGGYGSPYDRSPDAVLADVANGLVSVELAREGYGVVLSSESVLDESATEDIRVERRHSHAVAEFDLGPERYSYESVWTPEAQSKLAELLFEAPTALRDFLRIRIRDHIGSGHMQPSRVEPRDVESAARAVWDPVQRVAP